MKPTDRQLEALQCLAKQPGLTLLELGRQVWPGWAADQADNTIRLRAGRLIAPLKHNSGLVLTTLPQGGGIWHGHELSTKGIEYLAGLKT